MKPFKARGGWWLFLLLATVACTSSPSSRSKSEVPYEELPEVLGEIDQSAILAEVPDWTEARDEADVDLDTARRLAEVPPGASVTVYLGTWCSDSRREVSRLWRVLDELDSDEKATGLPFEVSYVGVDREKMEPSELVSGLDLLYVPTMVVRRGPLEVGRIVEVPLVSVEQDLASLLHGEAFGILTSSRPELLDESDE